MRITFRPYDQAEVSRFLKLVYQDFGRDKTRWYYRSPDIETIIDEPNIWILEFLFRDPHDATMFGLKYLK